MLGTPSWLLGPYDFPWFLQLETQPDLRGLWLRSIQCSASMPIFRNPKMYCHFICDNTSVLQGTLDWLYASYDPPTGSKKIKPLLCLQSRSFQWPMRVPHSSPLAGFTSAESQDAAATGLSSRTRYSDGEIPSLQLLNFDPKIGNSQSTFVGGW